MHFSFHKVFTGFNGSQFSRAALVENRRPWIRHTRLTPRCENSLRGLKNSGGMAKWEQHNLKNQQVALTDNILSAIISIKGKEGTSRSREEQEIIYFFVFFTYNLYFFHHCFGK